jgi:hypothetical protein
MTSLYDFFSDNCLALAVKAKREVDKLRLLQLADQWRTTPADHEAPVGLLGELGIDDDTILKDLGLKGRPRGKRSHR